MTNKENPVVPNLMVNNFPCISAWKTNKFLAFVFSVQSLMFILSCLSVIGFPIPVLMPAVGLFYLGFLPGIIILRLMRFHNLDSIRMLLYSAGLSLFFSMFAGLSLNLIAPLFGLNKPISIPYLLMAMTLILIGLCILICYRERDGSLPVNSGIYPELSFRLLSSPMSLLLILIPITSILGATVLRIYSSNTILLTMMIMICLVVILAIFNRVFSPQLYPVALFCIAIALIYQYTLISTDLTGWDAPLEYYFSHLTASSSYWNYALPQGYNGMLSITLLPVIFSYFLNIDVAWVYKIIYPIFFSLVPVALYLVFKRQTSEKVAFFAVFFSMSLQLFSDSMPSIMRQQVAELFFALLLVLMVTWEKGNYSMKILILLFTFAIIVSHYSTSYIFIFSALVGWLLLIILKRFIKIGPDPILNRKYISLCIVIALGCYIYIASGTNFQSFVLMGNQTYLNINDFLTLGSREGSVLRAVGFLQSSSLLHGIMTNLYRITQLFIVIGIFGVVFKIKKSNFQPGYLMSSLAILLLLFLSLVLPYFSQYLHIDRLYHLILFFLAPFCILGGITFFKGIMWLIKTIWIMIISFSITKYGASPVGSMSGSINIALVVILVLIPYFMFNTGFAYEVVGDQSPTSISLSLERFKESDSEESILHFNSNYMYETDIVSAEWLAAAVPDKRLIYCDHHSYWSILPCYGATFPSIIIYPDSPMVSGGLLYLSNLNINKKMVEVPSPEEQSNPMYHYPVSELSQFMDAKIYANGGSEIYVKR